MRERKEIDSNGKSSHDFHSVNIGKDCQFKSSNSIF